MAELLVHVPMPTNLKKVTNRQDTSHGSCMGKTFSSTVNQEADGSVFVGFLFKLNLNAV